MFGAVQSLAADDTAFALALYPPVAASLSPAPNLILSPYSVSATLTMLDVGAAVETATQIQTVLGLPGRADELLGERLAAMSARASMMSASAATASATRSRHQREPHRLRWRR